MSLSEQPEALRLAEYLAHFRSFPDDLAAAAELRRLYAENKSVRLDEIERINSARREAQARVAELTTELQKMRAHLHRSTAAAMNDPATRWYVIDKRGFATYCADWEDARDTARDADQAYPDNSPHVCGWMSCADMEGGAV